MKREQFLKSYFVLLLLFAFSMLVFGCGEKDKPKAQTEKVESKQPSEKNGTNTNEVDVKGGNTLGAGKSELVPINDQIQLEQWQQLVEELKETLGDMGEIRERAEQVSKPN